MKHARVLSLVLVSLAVASCSSFLPEMSEQGVPSTNDPLTKRIDQGEAKLVFERDANPRATACPALIYVDGTLRAKVGVSQFAAIPVRSGPTNVRIKLGKFCGSIDDRLISLKAASGGEYRYRIGIEDLP